MGGGSPLEGARPSDPSLFPCGANGYKLRTDPQMGQIMPAPRACRGTTIGADAHRPGDTGPMTSGARQLPPCPLCGDELRFEVLDDEKFLVAWSCLACGLIRTTEPV